VPVSVRIEGSVGERSVSSQVLASMRHLVVPSPEIPALSHCVTSRSGAPPASRSSWPDAGSSPRGSRRHDHSSIPNPNGRVHQVALPSWSAPMSAPGSVSDLSGDRDGDGTDDIFSGAYRANDGDLVRGGGL
jgi:hypothetical protein